MQFGIMIARSIETKDSQYEGQTRGFTTTKFMLTVEQLHRTTELGDEEFIDQAPG